MSFLSFADILLVNWFAGNGWYVYIETSWPRKMNDTARLISSSIPGTTASKGKCLSFWYHMYGADINTLSVYVRTGAHDSMLWSKTGTRGDKWIQGQATVTSRDHFKVNLKSNIHFKTVQFFGAFCEICYF